MISKKEIMQKEEERHLKVNKNERNSIRTICHHQKKLLKSAKRKILLALVLGTTDGKD